MQQVVGQVALGLALHWRPALLILSGSEVECDLWRGRVWVTAFRRDGKSGRSRGLLIQHWRSISCNRKGTLSSVKDYL